MKTYFVRCPRAKESRLLMRLDRFPHFKDGAKRYSMADLLQVQSGDLLHDITAIHKEFVTHIKRECSVSVEGRGGEGGRKEGEMYC